MRQVSPEPDHVPLRYLKGLVPKLLFYESELETYPEVREQFIKLLDGFSEFEVEQSQCHDQLDHSLQRIVRELSGPFRGFDLLRVFDNAVQGVNCGICAGGGRVPCCGDVDKDPLTLADPGHCIKALHVLFKVSCDLAHLFYKKHVPDFRDYQVYFHTQHSEEEPLHDIPAPYHVDGKTTITDADSTVVLTLNYRLLSAETFRSILYVLFHECFCHAYQGSVTAGYDGVRESCGPNDMFGEGWMDWLAAELLERFLKGVRTLRDQEELLGMVPRPIEMSLATENFHQQRKNIFSRRRSQYAHVHFAGSRLAEYVLLLLEDAGVEDPEDVFYALSLGLNASPSTRQMRSKLMEKMRQDIEPYYFPGSKQERLPRFGGVLRSYARHRSIETFWEEALGRGAY
jgi:hypothetical protein